MHDHSQTCMFVAEAVTHLESDSGQVAMASPIPAGLGGGVLAQQLAVS